MRKKFAEEIVKAFNEVDLKAELVTKPGTSRVWSVMFVIEATKKDAFEDILIDYQKLKLKVEYVPQGIQHERVFLY